MSNSTATPQTRKNDLRRAFRAYNWSARLRKDEVTKAEHSLLRTIAIRIDGEDICTAGRASLARDSRLAPDTVSRCISSLETKGLVKIDYGISRKGNLYYHAIRLIWTGPTDTGSVGVTDAGSVAPCLLTDPTSAITTEKIKTTTEQSFIEGKKPSPVGETGKTGNSIEEPGKVFPTQEKKKSFAAPAAVYEMTQYDWLAAKAMVWSDLFGAKAKGKKLGKRVGDELVSLSDSEQRLLKANEIVCNYCQNCEKSPKARVGFWFEIKRIYYPQLPSTSKGWKLPNAASKLLHQKLFPKLGRRACYVIAHAMANWPPYTGDGGGVVKKYPDIDSLLWDPDWLDMDWYKSFAVAFEWFATPTNEAIVTRLIGVWGSQKKAIEKLGLMSAKVQQDFPNLGMNT